MTETPHPDRDGRRPPEPAEQPEPKPEAEGEQPYSSDEEAEVAARLESLGYM
jgi:hypothetical protein